LADRYQIMGVMGSGDMGSVYRARDLHFADVEKIVAVKEFIISSSDPDVQRTARSNFEWEVNIVAALSHCSIPKIYDYFNYDDRSFLVLEFIHGSDLQAIRMDSDDGMDPWQVYQWALELCDVLQYLHSHKPEPIILRDLKASDIMVNQNNHVVLMSLGIAGNFQIGNLASIVDTDGYKTTKEYTSEAIPSADIYALGDILHHLLSRQVPHMEASNSYDESPRQRLNPDVPDGFEKIINKALAYNPDERYLTIEEMKNALIAIAGQMNKSGRSIKSKPNISPKIYPTTSPRVRWKFQCDDEVRGNLTCHNGLLLFGSYDQTLYALNHVAGDIAWKYYTDGGIVGEPCVHEDIVYIGSEDQRLYALSLKTGKLLWTFETRGPIRSSPKVIEDHVIVGSDDSCLHAIDINSTRETWKINVSGAIRSSPWVSHERVIFGCESGDMYCVSLSGQIQWSFRAKKAITASPVVAQGVVYVTSLDGMFYAIDEQEGWLLWKFRMDKGSVSSPIIHENVVYFGSAGGSIYAINTEDKTLRWKYKIETQVSGSPMIDGNNLYCGGADGNVYCIDSLSGELRWKFETHGAITGQPVFNQNLFFVGSSDKYIYAVEAGAR
jgi:outer membrane protein assembly factor BamB